MARARLVPLLMLLAAVQGAQARELTSCETNIVSATVLATYCSHASGTDDNVDLMILWRGGAGWFRRGMGRSGGGGSHLTGGGAGGHVSELRFFGDVEIRYDADFGAGVVTIGALPPIALRTVNAVLVDGVDRPEGGHVRRALSVAPRVTLGGDHNLKVIRSSRALIAFLQCDIPMPASPSSRPQPPVVTVCEKLAGNGR